MNFVLKNAKVYIDGRFINQDIFIKRGEVFTEYFPVFSDFLVLDFKNKFIFPGFTDVHVHLREPGFLYKETILTGTKAAAHGGYTTVCSMPNLSPAPDSIQNLAVQLEAIKNTAVIDVFPFGRITKDGSPDKLSDMQDIANSVIGFSDDGKGVQNSQIMKKAMLESKRLNKIISAHCEDESLLNGGYIHDGIYAKTHGHLGISSESEWRQIERDLQIVRETGCKYHICHISAKESVELIRRAKMDGLDVTCETAPHYLVLTDSDLLDNGRFKMNPPLRSTEDRKALIEGIKDGTIDMIATDHAPHSVNEKNGGLKNSLMGVVGIETAFPILYTHLVKSEIISLEKLTTLLCDNPKQRFGVGAEIKNGNPASLTVFDLGAEYKIDSKNFISKGKSTPFEGERVFGKCLMTMHNGEIIWKDIKI